MPEVWAWHGPVLLNPYNFASRLDYQQYTDKKLKTQMLSRLLKVTYPGSSRAVSPIPFYYFIAPLTHITQPFSYLVPQPHAFFF